MSQQPGQTDFFAMEAAEYLDRLDTVVSRGESPNGEEFLRLARALRGSALMANRQGIAGAAGGLEHLARAFREGRRPWDAATKQLAIRAVDDLKVLVRKLASWSPAEDAKARQLADDLQAGAGTAPAAARPGAGAGVADPGTRTFIAQQGASLASALDRTATALAQNPERRDVLQATLKVMQPLRGIASLADFPPLPDLLEGLERGIAQLSRSAKPGGDPAAMFRAAAKAISRAARDIATTGKADPDAPEASEFVRLLGAVLDVQSDVVPIESLYYGDAGPHVVQQGTTPARPAQLSNLELVSHGEHLRQAADALERAQSAAQRELRAHALASTFTALGSVGAGVLGSAIAAFARAARAALAGGMATADASGFAEKLRQAAGVLTAAGSEEEATLAKRMSAVTTALTATPPAAAASRTPATAGTAGTAAAPRRPAATPPGVASPPAVSAVSGVPPGARGVEDDGPGLAGSFSRFERYVATVGLKPASLDELLAGPPAAPAASAAPAPGRGGAAGAEVVVPITELCYSGPAAIERALSLRAQVRAALGGTGPDGAPVNDLLEEIFDLVQLAAGHKQ